MAEFLSQEEIDALLDICEEDGYDSPHLSINNKTFITQDKLTNNFEYRIFCTSLPNELTQEDLKFLKFDFQKLMDFNEDYLVCFDIDEDKLLKTLFYIIKGLDEQYSQKEKFLLFELDSIFNLLFKNLKHISEDSKVLFWSNFKEILNKKVSIQMNYKIQKFIITNKTLVKNKNIQNILFCTLLTKASTTKKYLKDILEVYCELFVPNNELFNLESSSKECKTQIKKEILLNIFKTLPKDISTEIKNNIK